MAGINGIIFSLPLYLLLSLFSLWVDKEGDFKKLSLDSETFYISSEGLGEMSAGDLSDMCSKLW